MANFKINKSLLLACDEFETIADSLENDTKIKVTAKGVNAINREFESNIVLSEIRKLKYEKFRDNFGNIISPQDVASSLRQLAKKIRSGESLDFHISLFEDIESALKIRLTRHLRNKSEFMRYMKKNNLTFKRGYSEKDYNIMWWADGESMKRFYFPFQYRAMTQAELNLKEKREQERRKIAGKKAAITKRKNAKKEQDRKRIANKKVKEMTAVIDEYIKNTSTDIPLFLDTETTGLNRNDEVIEIAIVDINENVLIDTLIHTKKRISENAYDVHLISQSDLEEQPRFREIEQLINKLVENRSVWIYNKNFDIEKMNKSSSKNWLFNPSNINCVMSLAMSRFTDGYYGISLENACHRLGLKAGGHRAKTDAIASAKLYKKLKGIND